MMSLLREWATWKPDGPPYLLEADREVLSSLPTAPLRKAFTTWRTVYRQPDFGAGDDCGLHFGLLPHPFCGDLERASIFVLMLNPGLGFQDYYGEYEVPRFRRALIRVMRQRFAQDSMPFMFLDPRFSWHGGFSWWHGKLRGIFDQLSKLNGISFAESRARFSRIIASIELVPYHSQSFSNEGGLAKKLPSAKLARDYVEQSVLPRVRRGDAIVIVARKSKAWGLLDDPPRVIVYGAGEARAAHLGPKSRGGEAILKFLTRRGL
jgi:hypothetical protein